MNTKHCIILSFFIFTYIYPVSADDWPRWRGVKYDEKSAERDLLQNWPKEGPKQIWLKEDIGLGYSGPTVSNGTLLIMGTNFDRNESFENEGKDVKSGSKELLFAKQTSNGSTKWTVELGDLYSNWWGHGPRGSATIDNKKVYALSSKGILKCINIDDGKVIWTKDLVNDLGGAVPKWGYTESPLIYNNLVICTPGGDEGTIAALDKETGKIIWRSKEWTDGAQYSSPVPARINNQNQIVQLTQKSFAGISLDDGKLLWKSIWPGRVAVIPTPIVVGDQVYVSSGYGVGCKKVTIVDGNPVEDYANKNMKNHHGGVILHDDHLYGYSDQIGWVCQNFNSGKIIWESKDFGKGCIFYADSRFYCVEEKSGTVVLLAASSKEYKEHGRFTLSPLTNQRQQSGGVWTHPVISNGILYLRDQEKLFAYNIKR
tara:strand:+ start:521 stop:1804 length:1284 start_codon:yes stop_codon:yes gene_type:complete